MRDVNIKADLYRVSYSIYSLKQYDATTLHISVYAKGEPYQLDGLRMSLTAVLPDGTAVIQADNAAIYSNQINIGLADAVVEQTGNVRFELVITCDDGHISTYIFSAVVESALLQKEKIIYEDLSGNIYKAVTAALHAAEALTEQTGAAKGISENIELYLRAIDTAVLQMQQYDAGAAESARSAAEDAVAALVSAEKAYQSQIAASAAAIRSKASEDNAMESKTNAVKAQNAAATSAINSAASETGAKTSELNAKNSETAAELAKSAAEQSNKNANDSEKKADAAKILAESLAAAAKKSEDNSKVSEANAKASETNSNTAKTAAETARTGAESARDKAIEQAAIATKAAEGATERLETLESIVNDLTVPVTATGNPAQLDGLVGGLPLVISADIVSTQAGSGDPSPDNIRKISGIDSLQISRTGKNLFNIGSQNQRITATYGTITNISNGYRNTITAVSSSQRTEVRIPNIFRKGKSHFISFNSNLPPQYTRVYEISTLTASIGASISNTAAFVPTDTPYIAIFLYAPINSSVGTVFDVWDIQIEEGATATDYEPYVGNSYNIALPETVFGLSAYPAVADLNNGTLTKRHTVIKVLDGTENWNLPTTATAGYSNYRISSFFSEIPIAFMCSHFVSKLNTSYSVAPYSNRAMQHPDTAQLIIQVSNNVADSQGQTSVTAWKAYLAAQYAAGTPVTLMYPLATPQTLTIEPVEILSLSGTNTVYTNGGGNVTVEGRQGWKPIVDEIRQAIKALGG